MKTTRPVSRNLVPLILITLLASPLARTRGEDASSSQIHKSPDWLRSATVYEIFPQQFSQEGNFDGITRRLDDLKDLGVNILWLMPIHPIGVKEKKGTYGSPYSVRDFYAINPALGSPDDFKRLVQQAHQRNLKVIIDIVAGQTSWDSVLMAHPEFYLKDASGKIIPPNPSWTDVAGLDYRNPELRRYMIDMMKYWLTTFSLDGFRCDVAYTVPVDFWEAARTELEKVNPNIIIIADAGAKPALLSKAFDMDYSWNLYSALNRVMDSTSPATSIEQSWEHTHDQFQQGALHLRFTDNQSEVRAVSRYSINGALAAQALMLTLDGVPLFYNGMEAGDATESTDPAMFEKTPVFWDPAGRPMLRNIYRDLIKLRKQYPAFANDDVAWLENTVSDQVVSFVRRDTKDEFLVLINLTSERANGSVKLPAASEFKPVSISGRPENVGSPLPDFQLSGYGWFLYHRSLGK